MAMGLKTLFSEELGDIVLMMSQRNVPGLRKYIITAGPAQLIEAVPIKPKRPPE
jgi:hypothetical protein